MCDNQVWISNIYLLQHSKHLIHVTIVFIDRKQCKIAIHTNNIYWLNQESNSIASSIPSYIFLILCEFNIMQTNPTHFPSLHICLPPLQPHAKSKKVSKKYLNVEAAMCFTVFPSTQTVLFANVRCNESLVRSQGLFVFCFTLRPHQDSSPLYCCFPVAWRSCNIVAIGPASSRATAVPRWGRCWPGPIQSLVLGLGGAELVIPLPLLLPCYQGRLFCFAQARGRDSSPELTPQSPIPHTMLLEQFYCTA